MMVRTQISLDNELQRQARQRANEIGVSFAEYVRRLVAHDLGRPELKADVSSIFDLGVASSSSIAADKDSMIGEAFQSVRDRNRRRQGSA